jgi:DNA modification methylase
VILQGDCIEQMRELAEASVDAIVCDPPYELGFMGKAWDRSGVAYHRATWEAALRVLKPGGHLLAFGGTRTYHRLACAIEDAGFEIRDSLIWIYGSGFPKSLDVSKAIDKAAGAEREVVGTRRAGIGRHGRDDFDVFHGSADEADKQVDLTAPATPEAQEWQGWGTALKPAHEPIVMARKPLAGTVAANVLEHGTGALNVDGCRVGTGEGGDREGEPTAEARYTENGSTNFAPTPGPRGGDAAGRWPANITLSPEAAEELDRQSGGVGGGDGKDWSAGPIHGTGDGATFLGEKPTGQHYGDTGGASRFFYVAKASRAERNAGLDGFEDGVTDDGRHTPIDNPYLRGETTRKNSHPTVKPIDLMRWLVRLVTPPGGTVLDPFLGSGTTGCAAALEGFDFIGIEREAEYLDIAKARIEFWKKYPGAETQTVLSSPSRDLEDGGQASLLEEAA